MNPICRVKIYPSEPALRLKTVAEAAEFFTPFLSQVIYPFAETSSVDEIWHFFEPYLELTWVDGKESGERFRSFLVENAKRYGVVVDDLIFDEKGELADWFCASDSERQFGADVHNLCGKFWQAYQRRKDSVDHGKGLHSQVGRTIHRLCNPLGINYKEEAKLCFSRGLICALFCMFGFKKAVWIYTKIFRQKY